MCGLVATNIPSISPEAFQASAALIRHRGPDQTTYSQKGSAQLCFHRLAIMDLSPKGQQPFEIDHDSKTLICNGEIYNHKELARHHLPNHQFKSGSDCEVLLPLILKKGLLKAAMMLDAEYALVVYDENTDTFQAARDPIGIRPLFYGYKNKEPGIAFASEAKALHDLCNEVYPFPPGHIYDGGKFVPYRLAHDQATSTTFDMASTLTKIRQLLTSGVEKRLEADAPLGALLSGGLDSSLVCAIAQKRLDKPLRTFAVGCSIDAIDIKYATEVAEYIGSHHTNVYFNLDDVKEALPEVIKALETWDITTIRAAIGMYIVCKHIRQNTDIKVLLTGEVSDELFGYKYTDFAPSPEAFQAEAQKRMRELYQYDVLRADRCISGHSLEARVPFGDMSFVDYVMGIKPLHKMNQYDMGKYLLRQAFAHEDLIPTSILFRDKAAFSDAVGHSVANSLKDYADKAIGQEVYEKTIEKIHHGRPVSKESLLYRRIFEEFFPDRAELIDAYWLPNQEWQNCQVLEPSARVLPNYGNSGV